MFLSLLPISHRAQERIPGSSCFILPTSQGRLGWKQCSVFEHWSPNTFLTQVFWVHKEHPLHSLMLVLEECTSAALRVKLKSSHFYMHYQCWIQYCWEMVVMGLLLLHSILGHSSTSRSFLSFSLIFPKPVLPWDFRIDCSKDWMTAVCMGRYGSPYDSHFSHSPLGEGLLLLFFKKYWQ